MKTKKVLITGSNGLLGQKLVELISKTEMGVSVVATSRGSNRLLQGNYSYRSMDVTDPEEVMQVITQEKPDVVIHTAALTNVDECELNKKDAWRNNVSAVSHIVKACENNDTFLVHISTDFIFKGDKGPLTEIEPPAPVNYYGETKLAAEVKIQKSNCRWAIARTVLVYGLAHDMSRSNIVLWVKNSLESKKPIQVVDDQFRTPTLAEDLATGSWHIAKLQKSGVYNISGDDFLTPYDMAMLTAEVFDLDKSLITKTDSTKFTQPAKRPLITGFLIDKARNELNYQPRSFAEGLELMKSQLEGRRD